MQYALAWLLTLSTTTAEVGADLRRFEYTRTEMATPVRVVLYCANETAARRAAEAAFSRIRSLNSVFSDYDPQSELRRLCRAATARDDVRVSLDLWRVLTRAQEISRVSQGAFDATIGPVVRLWRRARRLHRLPARERLEPAMALVDYSLVRLDTGHRAVRFLKAGLRLDLGGIAKGYAADAALEVLRDHGAPCALVDVGGDIATGAAPPGKPGWRIRIAPGGNQTPSRYFWLSRAAVATSGDSEQFVIIGGRRYSHLVDPRTGTGLTDHSCVTIVAPDSMTADALASAVSVLGPRQGLQLIEKTRGAAGRIVRSPPEGREIYESKRWNGLHWADHRGGAHARAQFHGGEPLAAQAHEPETPTGESEKTPAKGDVSQPVEGKPTEEAPQKEKQFDPTVIPPVVWMLEPVPLPDTGAKTQAEMKPYTERIPGTKVTFDMVPIPGGKFMMGSPPDEPKRAAHEGPQLEVELEPFWMGKCEVRWEEYELWGLGYDAQRKKDAKQELSARDRLADAITRPTKPYSDMTFGMGREGYPAICMTHLAAKVYCKWLSAMTGRYYRLPTEAEWEYAARAGTSTAYSFGQDPKNLGDYAWYFDNSEDRYHLVGQKKPNPWGLFDMHGNVAEWVLDQLTPDGYQGRAKPCRNPLVVPQDIYPRVVRGGSWTDDPDLLRCAARRGSTSDWKMGDPQIPQSIWYHTEATFVGFRVVRPLRVPTAKEAARYDLDEAQKFDLADYLEFLAGKE